MSQESFSRGSTFLSDETTFFALVAEHFGSPVPAAIRQIYDWSKIHVELDWGSGKNLAFQMRHRRTGMSILHIAADGWGWLYVRELMKISPFNEYHAIRELLGRFNSIPGIKLADKEITKFELKPVSAPETIQQILDVVAWAVEEMDRAAARR
jgi:hypothetical protein